MRRDKLLSPKALEKIEIPITIGIGLYPITTDSYVEFFPSFREYFLEQYPMFKWEFIIYVERDHLIEAVGEHCPQILIVSSYWGHSAFGHHDIDDPESEIYNGRVVCYYINKFLRETIVDRIERGSIKPFIILVVDQNDPRGYCDIYISRAHALAASIEYITLDSICSIVNILVELLPDEVFVYNS